MIENKYMFQQVNTKIIERIIDDENVNINHMVLTKVILCRAFFKLKCLHACHKGDYYFKT